ncbi:Nucleoporin nup49/NSP49 (Nuclear pore protein nup49/NSP49) [Lambiella insularis]|nr:Nucleoporin nup49/NSP49 (Nuclear pore protein nup49/NSP49) [Lambiella insularis]
MECSGSTSNNNATQAPLSGGLFGSSKPSNLFGSTTNASSASQSGGLFGASNNNQGGGLFGAQPTQTSNQPQPQPSNLFGSTSTQQAGGLFGLGTQQSLPQQGGGGLFGPLGGQTQNSQQQQGGGGGFSSLNQPAFLGGTGSNQSQAQQRPTLASQTSNFATSQQPQKSMFSTSIGQYSQSQQVIPGVRVNLSELRPTTRFNDLHDEVQKVIETVDNFIQNQITLADECESVMPRVASALSHIPIDVEFCARKFDAAQQALENDAVDIELGRKVVRRDAADARLSFKAIQNLRLPQQFQHSNLWSAPPAAQINIPMLQTELAEEDASTDLVSYFSKQADEMTKSLDNFKNHLAEVEIYLKGIEATTVQQMQRVEFTRSRDGGQRSADDQVRELAAVLREFEGGILGVAGKVGGVRVQVQEAMLEEATNQGRRLGRF